MQVFQSVEEIHGSGTVAGRDGRVFELHSSISREEGELIASTIADDPSIQKTLEVGCGYGLSALHICLATRGRPNAAHTIVDPFQHSQWDGVGIWNLERAGISNVSLIEVGSEFALPLLAQHGERAFDLVFIDGWATFDHKLLDCYYASRLLRTGGVLGVRVGAYDAGTRVVNLIESWPCFERIGVVATPRYESLRAGSVVDVAARVFARLIGRRFSESLLARRVHEQAFKEDRIQTVVLRKVSDDDRNWDWHSERF